MRSIKCYLLFVLILLGSNAYSQSNTTKKVRKVVYIIVDGIAEDMLDSTSIPNLKRIEKDGALIDAYVGGGKDTYSETPTISAVGYNSLLTGTWYNKHNVSGNYNQHPNYHYPTIFKIFKDQYPDKKVAIFSSWEDNRTVLIGTGLEATGKMEMDYAYDGLEKDTLRFPHDNEANYIKMIDYLVAKKASKYIQKHGPDLSWVYLQHSDDVAHKYGDSKILYQNITFEDQLVGRVYDAVKAREAKYNEDWLFIVTTDHGRGEKGYSHGGQSKRERRTWIVLNKGQVNAYAQNNRVGIVDIAPTILSFLNVKTPTAVQEEMDGIDLIKKTPAYDLKASLTSDNKLHVSWKTTPDGKKGKAEIYITTTNHFKTGGTDAYTLVGKTSLKKGSFTSKNAVEESDFYKVLLKTKAGYLNAWIVQ